jgi:hypothetical protein
MFLPTGFISLAHSRSLQHGKLIKIQLQNLKGRESLGGVSVGRRIILKRISNK